MRATQAPEQWQWVLDAINDDDYELANKLAVKYKFASKVNEEEVTVVVRNTPLKGDYVAKDPDGKIYCHERASVLSSYLGMVHSYVAVAIPRLERHGGEAKKGKMKGWKFWKEK